MKGSDRPKPETPDALPNSLAERREQGRLLRDVVRRNDQGSWYETSKRDPIEVLEQSNVGRIPELIPIRYGRMLASPLAFFRGSASLMAADLSSTPSTGLHIQICGDCHVLNFGAYSSPERNLIIDLNDFDETAPGPWEWDLKRLAASLVLTCNANSFKSSTAREVAETVGRSYREAMEEFSQMHVLDVWYAKMHLDTYLRSLRDKQIRNKAMALVKKEVEKTSTYFYPKIVMEKDGRLMFNDSPPLLYHPADTRDSEFMRVAREAFRDYRNTLSEERQVLLDRFEVLDIAMKVVGIGSVGTYCAVLLLVASENDSLILQLKEARASVLEPYTSKTKYKNHGQRVVIGQRLMQSHSDIFLGWTQGPRGRHFYLRQLRNAKIAPRPELWSSSQMTEAAQAFGWVLARAHARSGDPAVISGYIGTSDVFDKAIAQFAMSYANQTERYHKELVAAVKSGRVSAITEQ